MKRNPPDPAPPVPGRTRWKRALPAAFLVAIAAAAFLYTSKVREPWFGALSPYHHQWLTGSTVKFAKNWYREGAWNLRFWMLENPRSIEFPTMGSRDPYASYPPGTILPIHLLALISGREPTAALVMKYNLANHLLIAILLALAVYFFLIQVGVGSINAFALSLVPIFLELFLPGPMYWHQNVFFSDQAVILPAALFLFLEVLRGNVRNSKALAIIDATQWAVLFYGALTDWFMFVFASGIYLKRLVGSELGAGLWTILRRSALFWSPAVLAMFLFLSQLNSLDMFGVLFSKFKLRAAITDEGAASIKNFHTVFWKGYFPLNYGEIGVALAWISLTAFVGGTAYAVYRRWQGRPVVERAKKTLSLIGVAIAPCFVHNYFLKNHTMNHDFSTLKFSIPLAIVPFVLVPFLAAALFGKESALYSLTATAPPAPPPKQGKKKKEPSSQNKEIQTFRAAPYLLILATFAISGGYLAKEHPRFGQLFPPPEPSFAVLGDFFSRNSVYEDIVFSPYFNIPSVPPQLLSYTMKRVYQVAGTSDMHHLVKDVSGNYIVNLFLVGERQGDAWFVKVPSGNGWRELISAAHDVKQSQNIFLYKIKKPDFLRTSAPSSGW